MSISAKAPKLTLETRTISPAVNSYTKQHDPTCLQNTRVEVLREIYEWAEGGDEQCIFWLSSLAGTGKSTIARTVARTYFERNSLGASFFFSHGGGDVSHAGKFVTSIALQLASSIPSIHQYICDAITERSDIVNQSLRDQWHQLVLGPLSKQSASSYQSLYILVVDALDECDDDDDIPIILQLLAEVRSLKTVQIRVFLTSRPEIPIRYSFRHIIPNTEHQDFVLHNIPLSIVDHDIRIFFKYNLKLIREERSLGPGWPGEDTINCLVQVASGLFIWAATACRCIRDGKRFAAKRLDTILKGSGSAAGAPDKHLNEIYITVLKYSVSAEYTDEEKEESYYMLRQILGSIAVLFLPLPVYSLRKLLQFSKEDIDQTLDDLHSVLNVPKDETQPLYLHHPSFRDFLFNHDRCNDLNFWVDEKQAHQVLADSCIRLMSSSLKQDICGLDAPGVLVTNVKSSQVEQCLPPELQYACLYWIQHLQKSGTQLQDNDQVHQFLQGHLLHWFEALGWMGKVSEGIYAIVALHSITTEYDCLQLAEFVYDSKRFVLYNRLAIEQAPLQTYCSALVFTPAMSIVKRQFKDCTPRWIRRLPKVENSWNALLQTLEGHSDWVGAVAFSPDGKTLASVSLDGIKLWDADSGAIRQTIESHLDWVSAIAFSPDGKTLALVSDNRTINLWDADSGAICQTLEGHWHIVNAVAFSPDGKTLALASTDGTIELWDASLGVVRQTLKVGMPAVVAMTFSLDSKILASVSYNETIKLWDARSGTVYQTLKGWRNRRKVRAAAFSLCGKMLASAPAVDNNTINLLDASSGAIRQSLKGHLSWVSAVVFSPDGKTLASASKDKTIKLWDTDSGAIRQTFEGHSGWVTVIAFSPDSKTLASGSVDKTVKLWDTTPGAVNQTIEGHSHAVTTIAFSLDGKTLASASYKTIQLWDADSGAICQSLKGHLSRIITVAFSPDGKTLASVLADAKIILWDTSSGAIRQILKYHTHAGFAVTVSPDDKTPASASTNSPIRLWDADYSRAANAVAFSPDSKMLGSASNHATITFMDYSSAVAFSPDGKTLASALNDGTIKLWDADSGAVYQTVQVDHDVRTLSFSNDGAFLQINRGPLHISCYSNSAAVSRPNLPPSVFVKKQWVSWGTENILWLPSEYRPTVVAVYGNIVGFGYPSGRVAFMEFSF